jgi:hypothetical protein
MTPTRKTRRLAAALAVAAVSTAAGLAAAGPAAAYTPCPEDICPPVVTEKPLKFKWPWPNPCLSCPDPYVNIKDLLTNPALDRGLILDRGLEITPLASDAGVGELAAIRPS